LVRGRLVRGSREDRVRKGKKKKSLFLHAYLKRVRAPASMKEEAVLTTELEKGHGEGEREPYDSYFRRETHNNNNVGEGAMLMS